MSSNKAALFDLGPVKGKMAGGVKGPPKKAAAPSSAAPTARKAAPVKPLGLSAEQREIKRAEAAKLQAAGEDYVSTSLFKWSADHLGAAPKFEAAANAYNAAGDASRAWALMERAAQSHVETGTYGAAATALTNAAKIAAAGSTGSSGLDTSTAIGLRVKAAEMWQLYGDLVQGALCYCAGAELADQAEDAARAEELYLLARDSVLPSGALSSEADVKSASVRCLELLRQVFKFLCRDTSRLSLALEHSRLLLLV